MPIDQPKPAAPYLPWKTFLNSVDVFSQAMPPRIHRTIWRQSGLMQGLLMGAYRFFGLVDEDYRPTAALTKLSTAPSEERTQVVADMLRASYPEIMSHDLTTMTIPILHELIEKYNVGGATKKKAVTFFLQAAKFANLPLSSFIQTRSSGPRRRRARIDEELGEEMQPSTSSATEKRVELNSGGTLTLKVDVDFLSLSESDRSFVFGLVDKLAGYMQKRPITSAKGAA
jgi:hypothetical protein